MTAVGSVISHAPVARSRWSDAARRNAARAVSRAARPAPYHCVGRRTRIRFAEMTHRPLSDDRSAEVEKRFNSACAGAPCGGGFPVTNLLFDAPWWLPTVLVFLGVALF